MDKIKFLRTDAGAAVEVWNRRYEFNHSAFPTSVTVGENEILFAPVRLTASFGEKEGVWRNSRVVCADSSEKAVRFSVSQETENIILNAEVGAEEDGLIKIDLTVMNYWSFSEEKAPRLSGLSLDIPLKKEYASLMHYWPNCDSSVCLSQTVLNSHSVPDGRTVLGFKPYLWAGWEYGGIGICCESEEPFETADRSQCMYLEKTESCVNIHITLLDKIPGNWQGRCDQWGDTLKPLMFSFGLQATPVKKFDPENLVNWRAFQINISDSGDLPKLVSSEKIRNEKDFAAWMARKGVKWVILHEAWSLVQNYGIPWKEEQFREFVTQCHGAGIRVMTYFGYEMSTLCPGFRQKSRYWLNRNDAGNFVGGWQRRPAQRDFTVCYHGGYSDVMLERVRYVMDTYGVDGIYTDGTYVPWECANEDHGCGYLDPEGKRHSTYPIFAVREHVRKLYEEVHRRGGVIDTHQSSCCLMATLSYADSYYDGENIQGMLAENLEKLKLDTFRCEFTGLNLGIPCNFISYTNENYTIRKIAGITFLHNVLPRAGTERDLDFISKLWRIIDRYHLSEAKWHPYWEQKEILTDGAKSYVSYFETGSSLILAAVNHDVSQNRLRLSFRGSFREIRNLLDGGPASEIREGKAEVRADAMDLQIYSVC